MLKEREKNHHEAVSCCISRVKYLSHSFIHPLTHLGKRNSCIDLAVQSCNNTCTHKLYTGLICEHCTCTCSCYIVSLEPKRCYIVYLMGFSLKQSEDSFMAPSNEITQYHRIQKTKVFEMWNLTFCLLLQFQQPDCHDVFERDYPHKNVHKCTCTCSSKSQVSKFTPRSNQFFEPNQLNLLFTIPTCTVKPAWVTIYSVKTIYF